MPSLSVSDTTAASGDCCCTTWSQVSTAQHRYHSEARPMRHHGIPLMPTVRASVSFKCLLLFTIVSLTFNCAHSPRAGGRWVNPHIRSKSNHPQFYESEAVSIWSALSGLPDTFVVPGLSVRVGLSLIWKAFSQKKKEILPKINSCGGEKKQWFLFFSALRPLVCPIK